MPKQAVHKRSRTKQPARRKPPRTKFLHVAVSDETRNGLEMLKAAMNAANQAEVVARLTRIGVAIHLANSRR